MAHARRFAVRILFTTAVFLLAAFFIGNEVSDIRVREIMQAHGAKEFTDLPEYQGIGFAAIGQGIVWGCLGGSLAALAAWFVSSLVRGKK